MSLPHRALLSKVLAAVALGSAGGAMASACTERDRDAFQRPASQCEAQMCQAEPRDGESRQTVCLEMAGDTCGACDESSTLDAVEDQLAGQCGFIEAKRIDCGPNISDTGFCCYAVAYTENLDGCDQTTIGRPFVVQGEHRTASARRGTAWSADAAPSLAGLTAAEREHLARAWTKDALFEHASVASFARHTLELMSLGAPPELVAGAQQAALDEIEHARLCFALASAYAGRPIGPGRLSLQDAGPRTDPLEVAVALVHEGCIGETLAAAEATAARDVCTDTAVAVVLDQIARDEARHAALAWRTVAWLLRRGDARMYKAVRDAFEMARTRAGGSSDDDHGHPDHGRLDATQRRMCARQTFEQVIDVAARDLLGARSKSSSIDAASSTPTA
jgi:hypothetical protein